MDDSPRPSAPQSRVLPATGHARMRWKNGAGWTSEILREPDGDDWQWRLSIAEVEAEAPFSVFPGVERELVLLDGEGLRLRFGDGEVRELHPPHERIRFAGEHAIVGEPINGPTRDFNLMFRRDEIDAELWHRPLVGTQVLFVAPGETWVVHLMAGQARFADDSGLPPLHAGDTAILRGGGARIRHVLDGGGEALLVRVRRKLAA